MVWVTFTSGNVVLLPVNKARTGKARQKQMAAVYISCSIRRVGWAARLSEGVITTDRVVGAGTELIPPCIPSFPPQILPQILRRKLVFYALQPSD